MKSFLRFLAEDAVDNSFIYFIVYPSIKDPRVKNLYIGIRYGMSNAGEQTLFAGLRSNIVKIQDNLITSNAHTNQDLWNKSLLKEDTSRLSRNPLGQVNQETYMSSSQSNDKESLISVYTKGFSDRKYSAWNPRIISRYVMGEIFGLNPNSKSKRIHPDTGKQCDAVYKFKGDGSYNYNIFSAVEFRKVCEVLNYLANGGLQYTELDSSLYPPKNKKTLIGKIKELSNLFQDAKKNKNSEFSKKMRSIIDRASAVLHNEIRKYHKGKNINPPSSAGELYNDVNKFRETVYSNIMRKRRHKGLIPFLEIFITSMLFEDELETWYRENAEVQYPDKDKPDVAYIQNRATGKTTTQSKSFEYFPSRKGGKEFFEEIYLPKEFTKSNDKQYRERIIDHFSRSDKEYNWLNKIINGPSTAFSGTDKQTLVPYEKSDSYPKVQKEEVLTELKTTDSEQLYLSKIKKKMTPQEINTNKNGFQFIQALVEGKIKFKNIFLETNGRPEVKITLDQFRKIVFKSKRRK